MSQAILMSDDSHSLRVRVSQLESAIEEHKRMIYHLESVLQQERSENSNLTHMLRSKNSEIEDLKALLVSKDEERVELFEQVQRFLSSSNMPDREPVKPETQFVSRWVQTLVEFTAPEEVEEMKDEIAYLREQLEESELELVQTRRMHADSMFEFDDSGSDNDDGHNESFRRPTVPQGLNLNLNLGSLSKFPGGAAAGTQASDKESDDDDTASERVDCTPRLTSKLVLISPRFAADGAVADATAAPTGSPTTVTNNNAGNVTHRRNRTVSETPRITTARLFRSTYIDPTTSAARRNMSVIGDTQYHSPIHHSPSPHSPSIAKATFTPPEITAATPRRVISDEELKKAEQGEHPTNAYSLSMLKDTRAYNIARESTLERDELAVTIGSLNQTHMFGLDENPDCPICSLITAIREKYVGKPMQRKEAFYAAGWIPDLLQGWADDHSRVWTLEERTMIATALADRPKLSTLRNRQCEGYVYLWRRRRFWNLGKKVWKPVYAVLQGVFLYVFNSNVSHERLLAIIPVRSSYIETVQLSNRTRCLQISSLGCKHCVAGKDGDCVETMTISVDTDEQLGHWVVALQMKQQSCAHKCSSRILSRAEGIRDVAELLIELGSVNERKDIVNRSRFRSRSIQGSKSPDAKPLQPDTTRECSALSTQSPENPQGATPAQPLYRKRPSDAEDDDGPLNSTLTPTHHPATPPPGTGHIA